MRDEDLAFYTAQSPVTDPGRMSAWLGGLPSDIAALQRLARVLVIHYRADSPLEEGIAPERLAEIDTRYAEAMFSRLAELREGPFEAGPRQPAERLVGCCRDFTILFVSLARAAGIPARARVGFAPYFIAGFNLDHEVAEVWDAATGRWRLVDAQLGDDHRDPNDGERIDPLDVGRDRFLVAGEAWRRCRGGEADPERFLVGPDVDVPGTRSWPYIAHNLVQDLANLNKVEVLLWDYWGIMLRERFEPGDLELFDRLADLTASGDPDLAQLRQLYAAAPELQVPATVTSGDPLGGPPRQVALG